MKLKVFLERILSKTQRYSLNKYINQSKLTKKKKKKELKQFTNYQNG